MPVVRVAVGHFSRCTCNMGQWLPYVEHLSASIREAGIGTWEARRGAECIYLVYIDPPTHHVEQQRVRAQVHLVGRLRQRARDLARRLQSRESARGVSTRQRQDTKGQQTRGPMRVTGECDSVPAISRAACGRAGAAALMAPTYTSVAPAPKAGPTVGASKGCAATGPWEKRHEATRKKQQFENGVVEALLMLWEFWDLGNVPQHPPRFSAA